MHLDKEGSSILIFRGQPFLDLPIGILCRALIRTAEQMAIGLLYDRLSLEQEIKLFEQGKPTRQPEGVEASMEAEGLGNPHDVGKERRAIPTGA